jgi:hypothetical protein
MADFEYIRMTASMRVATSTCMSNRVSSTHPPGALEIEVPAALDLSACVV